MLHSFINLTQTGLTSESNTQHKALTIRLGTLYPAPEIVRTILAPQEGVTKRIVDLGEFRSVARI